MGDSGNSIIYPTNAYNTAVHANNLYKLLFIGTVCSKLFTNSNAQKFSTALVKPLCLIKIDAIKGNIFPIIILKATQHVLKNDSPFPQKHLV